MRNSKQHIPCTDPQWDFLGEICKKTQMRRKKSHCRIRVWKGNMRNLK